MTQLIKVAGPLEEPRATAVLVHGLGGHLYDTWRCGDARTVWNGDPTFWPHWLARDCDKLAVYVIGYDAPVSRLRGTAMHFTDQAMSILARILAEPALSRGPFILIGHSLGGLVIKQLLRTAESMGRARADAADLVARVEKVAFLATPHSGAGLATWGDRLRILARPSAATASLIRNDPGLRDLNNWYRDWANDRGIVHLVLSETRSTHILGMLVPPDSADPGLANVRSVPIAADHRGICKPVDDTIDIYVLVRDFIIRPAEQAKPPLEAKLDALPEAVVAKLIAAMDARGETARAAEAGLERNTILELARRLKPDEVLDLHQAVKELTAAVEVAVDVMEKGARTSNLDDLVDAVRVRIAERTRVGDFEGAARDADQGFAEWARAEAERREASVRSGIALLEAGLEQDILRRDAPSVARRVEKIVGLERAGDAAAHFAAMRDRQGAFYERGRNRGVNFDLLVAIEIAGVTINAARNPDELGRALDDMGSALKTLGERESGTTKLETAVRAFRAALMGFPRERAPLEWATIQNNLGNALTALGEREDGTEQLEEAVVAYREALREWSREQVPLQWATVQNNLGNALRILGKREGGTAKLEAAVIAHIESLKELTRERAPLDWAMAQNNLGLALIGLGTREGGTAKLEAAVTAYREALKEFTPEREPLDWAATQNNLGNALRTLGEREKGTAHLDEAVAAYRQALKQRTRERVPLLWAGSLGNEGVALMLLAERRGEPRMAETALNQITTAFETTRDGGHAADAALFEAELTLARSILARLRGQTNP